MMRHAVTLTAVLMFLFPIPLFSQSAERAIRAALNGYFSSYTTSYTTPTDRCSIEKVKVDKKRHKVTIDVNELFYGQSFSESKVAQIYEEVRSRMPKPYHNYSIVLMGGNYPIEQLVTDIDKEHTAVPKRWEQIYTGPAWTECEDKAYTVTKGMQGRHLMVWASHGKYYKNKDAKWAWQRPLLYCTTEDMLTQSIVNPFLIPMLENAGACVYTPRERDSQTNECIVDNDTPTANGYYEEKGRIRWAPVDSGFAYLKTTYFDGENPFRTGTARKAATSQSSPTTEVRWTPSITQSGSYVVYVSYANLPAAIPDAHYTVCHSGITTHYKVNQRMGGGTWVYLGTFRFEADAPDDNYVSLSNYSTAKGVVSADAVRFGGGKGNISRGGTVSGAPRCLEGARYYAQWAGMPYTVYAGYAGSNDYNDDINTRANVANYLASGSCYLPANSEGLRVPLELTIALHTDAGISQDDYIGTLGIYTTNNTTLPTGISRLTSRDLCDIVMTQVDNDLNAHYGYWHRRPMYDRNYSETRVPQIPSIILEMFSHQNFNDMVKGHDPTFKFLIARAVYKGLLKYTSYQRGTDYVVQPLPVTRFFTTIDDDKRQITLRWKPQEDKLEPTARPKGYVVYVREEGKDFDNGTYVHNPTFTIEATQNKIYSFKVTATNEGGESFPSETLTAMIAKNEKANVIIIDGFQRLAGPQVISNDTAQGFDIDADIGVPYSSTNAFCGSQTVFNPNYTPTDDRGKSTDDLECITIQGNTLDHCKLHATSIAAVGGYSFASASRSAVEAGDVHLNDYLIADLILGLQKDDGYSTIPYPALTPSLCKALQDFTMLRGRLLVSGAYITSGQAPATECANFLRNILKIKGTTQVKINPYTQVTGMNTTLFLYTIQGEEQYAVTNARCLTPLPPAFSTLIYTPGHISAAVAYKGTQYSAVTLGFPFECVRYAADRDKIMRAFLKFLTSN